MSLYNNNNSNHSDTRLHLDPMPCPKAKPTHCRLNPLHEPQTQTTSTQYTSAELPKVVSECPRGSSSIQIEHIGVAVLWLALDEIVIGQQLVQLETAKAHSINRLIIEQIEPKAYLKPFN